MTWDVVTSYPRTGITLPSNISDKTMDDKSILIYPNPVIDELTVQSKSGIDTFSFSLFNSIGQLLNQGRTNTISFHELPAGVYFVKINESYKKVVKHP
jgi:hypothetical protein